MLTYATLSHGTCCAFDTFGSGNSSFPFGSGAGGDYAAGYFLSCSDTVFGEAESVLKMALFFGLGRLRWVSQRTHSCMTTRAWKEADCSEELTFAGRSEDLEGTLLQPEDSRPVQVKDTEVTEVKAGVETGRSERLMFAGFSVRAKESSES